MKTHLRAEIKDDPDAKGDADPEDEDQGHK